MRGHLENK